MKTRIITNVIALVVCFGAADVSAQGACVAGLTTAALVTTLSGKYVCAKRTTNNDTWNELHQGTTAAGGPIKDYKLGPNDPIDPSKVVGTYSIGTVQANTVTYNYSDAGSPYTYVVRTFPNPGSDPNAAGHQFCNVATGELIPAIISTSPTHPLCGNVP